MKFVHFVSSPNKLDRILSILEIRFNLLFFARKPSDALQIDELLLALDEKPELRELLQDLETKKQVDYIRDGFEAQANKLTQKLPFPIFYNAEESFATLVYAVARYVCPDLVIETCGCEELSARSRSNIRRFVACESWQFTQTPFTGGLWSCDSEDFAWQAKQIRSLGMSSSMVVMSPRV